MEDEVRGTFYGVFQLPIPKKLRTQFQKELAITTIFLFIEKKFKYMYTKYDLFLAEYIYIYFFSATYAYIYLDRNCFMQNIGVLQLLKYEIFQQKY